MLSRCLQLAAFEIWTLVPSFFSVLISTVLSTKYTARVSDSMAKFAGAKLRTLVLVSNFHRPPYWSCPCENHWIVRLFHGQLLRAIRQEDFSMGRPELGYLSGRNILFGGKNFSGRTMPREVCVARYSIHCKKLVEIPLYISTYMSMPQIILLRCRNTNVFVHTYKLTTMWNNIVQQTLPENRKHF